MRRCASVLAMMVFLVFVFLPQEGFADTLTFVNNYDLTFDVINTMGTNPAYNPLGFATAVGDRFPATFGYTGTSGRTGLTLGGQVFDNPAFVSVQPLRELFQVSIIGSFDNIAANYGIFFAWSPARLGCSAGMPCGVPTGGFDFQRLDELTLQVRDPGVPFTFDQFPDFPRPGAQYFLNAIGHVTPTTTVPEPSTLTLALTGLLAGFLWRAIARG